MKHNLKWATAMVAVAGGLMAASWARADVTIDNFQNFQSWTPGVSGDLYASWASPAATITQTATGWEVASVGYGSLWKYEGDINGSGMAQVRLTIDITGDPGFIAGPIVDLVDNNGAWGTYAWYGINAPGSYVLTADLSTTPWLNLADIQHIHLECDPGSAATITYDLTFRDLSLIAPVPEPTSLAVLALGTVGLLIARRRVR